MLIMFDSMGFTEFSRLRERDSPRKKKPTELIRYVEQDGDEG